MSKIPTAEEILDKHLKSGKITIERIRQSQIEAIQEFAKLHVEAALEEASEKAELEGDEGSNFDYISVDKNSILNAYPLENIK